MDIQVASNFERLIFDICTLDSDKTLKLMNNLNQKGNFSLEKNELKRNTKRFVRQKVYRRRN